MKKQDFIDRIKAIESCEDETERRTLFADIIEDTSKDYDELERITEENNSLNENNEKLRDANMKLFLKVGESKPDEVRKKDQTGIEDKETPKRKFEDLFDEKGGIK